MGQLTIASQHRAVDETPLDGFMIPADLGQKHRLGTDRHFIRSENFNFHHRARRDGNSPFQNCLPAIGTENGKFGQIFSRPGVGVRRLLLGDRLATVTETKH